MDLNEIELNVVDWSHSAQDRIVGNTSGVVNFRTKDTYL
jgi:hypothetical protein